MLRRYEVGQALLDGPAADPTPTEVAPGVTVGKPIADPSVIRWVEKHAPDGTVVIGKAETAAAKALADYTEGDLAVQRIVADAATHADAAIERFRPDEAIASIWTIVDALNGYITENEPWALAKRAAEGDGDASARARLGTMLYTAAEGLRALAVLLSPVMPESTEKLWVALGAGEALGRLVDQPLRAAGEWGTLAAGTSVNGLAPLFPRVEQPA